MTINAANNNPRIEYTVAEGATQTVFTIPFEFFEDPEVKLYVDGVLKTQGSGDGKYTVTGGEGSTGTATFNTVSSGTQPVTGISNGSTVIIVRDIPIERVTDFSAGADINRAALNTQLDTLTALVSDADTNITRSLAAPVTDVDDSNGAVDMSLPNKATRAGKALGFNSSTGNPEAITFYDSAADVRAAVEAASDSNVFTDADHSKLDGIEANATADQTASEIRTLVESATDSNVFTDADHTKLNAIEDNATADQTASEILTAVKTVDGATSGLDADLLDGQHGSYYTGYADTAVSNLVDSAPSALDTLNELAAALGDDANFSTTVTNSIATKMPLAGGTMTGNIVMSGSQTVDGRDLSVDGAKLDGIEASADVTDTANVTAAGALMDSEVTNLAQVKAFDSSDYATAAQGSTADAAMPKAGGTFTGDVTFEGAENTNRNVVWDKSDSALEFADNAKIKLGQQSDLQIHHDAQDSYISANISGNLYLRNATDDFDVVIQSDSGAGGLSDYFRADGSTGEAKLFHYGSEKLKTQSVGVDITGDITVSGTVDGRDIATNIPSSLGTAGQVLTVNSGASAAEWADVPSDSNPNYTKVSLSHSGSQQTRYIKIATLNTATPSTSNSTFVFSILLDGRGSDQGASEFTVHIRSGDLSATSSVVVEQNHNNKHSIYGTDSFIFFYNNQYDSEFWFKLPNSGATSYQAVFAKLIMAANQDTTYVSGQDDVTIHTGQSWFSSAPSGTNQITAQWIKKKFSNILLDGVITEDVYNVTLGSGTHQIKPSDDGGIFYMTVSVNCSLGVSNLENGQSQVLMIDDGSGNTLTWPTMTWINNGGSAPTLSTTARTTVVVWKANNVVYGALVGDGT